MVYGKLFTFSFFALHKFMVIIIVNYCFFQVDSVRTEVAAKILCKPLGNTSRVFMLVFVNI